MDLFLPLVEAAVMALLGCVMLYVAKQVVAEATDTGTLLKPLPLKITAVVMLAVNILFVLFVPQFYGTENMDMLRTLLMLSILWPCAWADASAYLIPNRVLFFGSIASLLLLGGQILADPTQARYLLISTATAVGGLMLAALLCRLVAPKSMGMGDIKLLGVMGLCLGFNLIGGVLLYAMLATFFFGVFLLVTKKAARSDSIPFAPLLLVGTMLAAFLSGV